MSDEDVFDPLKMRAEKKQEKVIAEARKSKLKKLALVILLPLLIIGGMFAVGGTGQHSDWVALQDAFAPVAEGTAGTAELDAMLAAARKIRNVRGNRNALAGVITVYALENLKRGNNSRAQGALGMLRNDFSDEAFFSALADRKNLTKPCPACSKWTEYVPCTTCHGTGRVPAPDGRLSGGRNGETVECLVCHGTGKIKATHGQCRTCGGRGWILDRQAVEDNLSKAVKRAGLLLKFKMVQTLL